MSLTYYICYCVGVNISLRVNTEYIFIFNPTKMYICLPFCPITVIQATSLTLLLLCCWVSCFSSYLPTDRPSNTVTSLNLSRYLHRCVTYVTVC